jgi:hypothetical protein
MEVKIIHTIQRENGKYLWSEFEVVAYTDTELGKIEGKAIFEADLTDVKPEDFQSQLENAIQYASNSVAERVKRVEKNLAVLAEIINKYSAEEITEVKEKADP